MERLKEALSAAGIAYKENEPLCAHCTFRIGGPADLFVLPENEEQLCAAIRLAKEAGAICWATAATSCSRMRATAGLSLTCRP